MYPIIQHSLIIFSLMVVCAGFIQYIIHKISVHGILPAFSALILAALVIDSELLFILGQIEFSIVNVIMIFLPAILLTIGAIYIIHWKFVQPVQELTASAVRLAEGSLQVNFLVETKNEIGDLSRAKQRVQEYQADIAGLARRIADGDFDQTYAIKSTDDEPGLAFSRMLSCLQNIIQLVTGSARTLQLAAGEIEHNTAMAKSSSREIEKAAGIITTSTQELKDRAAETLITMEHISQNIQDVSLGAMEQTAAIEKVTEIAKSIQDSLDQLSASVSLVSSGAMEAANASKTGVHIVNETMKGLELIQKKVTLSAEKVENLGSRSEEIGDIVETIEDIASQTNLLALNAAIEAARAESAGIQSNEKLSQTHLLGIAKMLSELLARSAAPIGSPDLAAISRLLNVEVLSYTDEDGLVVAGSQPELLGFRFPSDGKGQAAVFRPLLDQQDGMVAQPVMARDTDGKAYLFVGVSRRDKKGIVQAGNPAESLLQLGNNSRGFAVVADEVRKLAERSSLSTREIAVLIKGIQKTVAEAVTAMNETSKEVISGADIAKTAGEVINRIRVSTDSVHMQLDEAGKTAEQVSLSAAELLSSIGSVSPMISEISASAVDLAVRSNQLTGFLQNINKLGEENIHASLIAGQAAEKVIQQINQTEGSAASVKKQAGEQLKAVLFFQSKSAEDNQTN